MGDKVWFDPGGSRPLEGPYLVSKLKPNGWYALCHDDDDHTPVHNAEDAQESQLRIVHDG